MADTHQLLRLIFALGFVLALMGLLNLALKRYGGARLPVTGKKRRLQIVETLPIDMKRRLVIVRRDDVEHLLVLGPSTETVIEQGIVSGQDDGDGVTPASPVPFDPVP